MTLNRSSFKRQVPDRVRSYPSAIPEHQRRSASMTPSSAACEPIDKENALYSKAYRMAVASLPCINCGRVGHSQHAHENENKGKALKLDDRRAMPLCADDYGIFGCHSRFDRYALFLDRAEHIRMGREWAAQTRKQIENLGLWPANFPRMN